MTENTVNLMELGFLKSLTTHSQLKKMSIALVNDKIVQYYNGHIKQNIGYFQSVHSHLSTKWIVAGIDPVKRPVLGY